MSTRTTVASPLSCPFLSDTCCIREVIASLYNPRAQKHLFYSNRKEELDLWCSVKDQFETTVLYTTKMALGAVASAKFQKWDQVIKAFVIPKETIDGIGYGVAAELFPDGFLLTLRYIANSHTSSEIRISTNTGDVLHLHYYRSPPWSVGTNVRMEFKRSKLISMLRSKSTDLEEIKSAIISAKVDVVDCTRKVSSSHHGLMQGLQKFIPNYPHIFCVPFGDFITHTTHIDAVYGASCPKFSTWSRTFGDANFEREAYRKRIEDYLRWHLRNEKLLVRSSGIRRNAGLFELSQSSSRNNMFNYLGLAENRAMSHESCSNQLVAKRNLSGFVGLSLDISRKQIPENSLGNIKPAHVNWSRTSTSQKASVPDQMEIETQESHMNFSHAHAIDCAIESAACPPKNERGNFPPINKKNGNISTSYNPTAPPRGKESIYLGNRNPSAISKQKDQSNTSTKPKVTPLSLSSKRNARGVTQSGFAPPNKNADENQKKRKEHYQMSKDKQPDSMRRVVDLRPRPSPSKTDTNASPVFHEDLQTNQQEKESRRKIANRESAAKSRQKKKDERRKSALAGLK